MSRLSCFTNAEKHYFEPISRLPHGAAAGKNYVAAMPRYTGDYTVPNTAQFQRFLLLILITKTYMEKHGRSLLQCSLSLIIFDKIYSQIIKSYYTTLLTLFDELIDALNVNEGVLGVRYLLPHRD